MSKYMPSIQGKLPSISLESDYQLFSRDSDHTNLISFFQSKKHIPFFPYLRKMSFFSTNTTVLIVATKYNHLMFLPLSKGTA